MSLPTYEEAMASPKQWDWSLIGPYLNGTSLTSCCLTSKKFNKTFSSFLWSDPVKILAAKKRPFYSSYLFMEIARGASIELRSLVHTLDFSPLVIARVSLNLADIECQEVVLNGVWFLRHTCFFPNLRVAVMDGIKSFDGNYMIMAGPEQLRIMALDLQTSGYPEIKPRDFTKSIHSQAQLPVQKTVMNPLILSAAGCIRATGSDLMNDINGSKLIYLDLSETRSDFWSLSSQTPLPNLRILKLRELRLTELKPPSTAEAHLRLWSLDVRNNYLTDASVERLLDKFLLQPLPHSKKSTAATSDQELFEEVPEYSLTPSDPDQASASRDDIISLRPDSKDSLLKYFQTHGHLQSSDGFILSRGDPLLEKTGLTQLYISGNKLTSRSVSRLIAGTNRLQVLDVGSTEVLNLRSLKEFYTHSIKSFGQANSTAVDALSRDTMTRLENLRIHHSIVTYCPTIVRFGSSITPFTLPLVEEAEKFGREQMQSWKAFTPLSNYRITTLTLTDVPTKSYGWIINRLVDLLNSCLVQEQRIVAARRNLTSNASNLRRAPKLLPGLRTLRLEFLPLDTSPQSPDGGSVSGDRDADAFLAESVGDFSFFDDPNTMSSVSRRASVVSTGSTIGGTAPGTPASRNGSFIQRTRSALERPNSSSSSPPGSSSGQLSEARKVMDVVDELKKFRARQMPRWSGSLELAFPRGR